MASVSPIPLFLKHLWQMAVPLKGQLLMLSLCLHTVCIDIDMKFFVLLLPHMWTAKHTRYLLVVWPRQ